MARETTKTIQPSSYSIELQFQLTSSFEGKSLKPYRDTQGKWTIGYGRNLTDKGISPSEAKLLCQNDLSEALQAAQNYAFWPELNPARQMVIVDMIYNLGPAKFATFLYMLKALKNKDYESAAAYMGDSLWFHQVKSRAVKLCQIMKSGEIL